MENLLIYGLFNDALDLSTLYRMGGGVKWSQLILRCIYNTLPRATEEDCELPLFVRLDSWLGIELELAACKCQLLECGISCKELLVDSRGLFERAEYGFIILLGLLTVLTNAIIYWVLCGMFRNVSRFGIIYLSVPAVNKYHDDKNVGKIVSETR